MNPPQSFELGYSVFIGIHFALVALIKGTFAKELHVKGRFSTLASILNVSSSQLVYVRIMPLVVDGDDVDDDDGGKGSREEQYQHHHHGTFFSQFLFSVLVLAENLLLCASPVYDGAEAEDGLELEVKTASYNGAVGVIVLWMAGLAFTSLFYKVSGHPWKDINGPLTSWGVAFPVYFCGAAKTLEWRLRRCKKSSFWRSTFAALARNVGGERFQRRIDAWSYSKR